jgi:hypothetical protein
MVIYGDLSIKKILILEFRKTDIDFLGEYGLFTGENLRKKSVRLLIVNLTGHFYLYIHET